MTEAILIAVIGSSTLAALVTNLFNVAERRKKTNDGVREGVQLLLYDRIKTLAKQHISTGHITAEDLEDLTHMWQCYHGPLGGNGYLDDLMTRVGRLPIN